MEIDNFNYKIEILKYEIGKAINKKMRCFFEKVELFIAFLIL